MEEKKNETADLDDKWIYHSMIYKMVEELNYTPNDVYELVVVDALNWLSFFKERDDYKIKLADQQKGITRY